LRVLSYNDLPNGGPGYYTFIAHQVAKEGLAVMRGVASAEASWWRGSIGLGGSMFDHTSRYYRQQKLQFQRPDGRVVSYVARRMVPSRDDLTVLAQVRLTEGQRLDTIAATALGASELFWQICDANSELNPFDLMSRVGEFIKIPMPGRQAP